MTVRLSRSVPIEITVGDSVMVIRFARPPIRVARPLSDLITQYHDSPSDLGLLEATEEEVVRFLSTHYVSGSGAVDVDGERWQWPARGDDDGLADLFGDLIPLAECIALANLVTAGRFLSDDRLGKFGIGRRSSAPPATSATSAETPSESSETAACPSPVEMSGSAVVIQPVRADAQSPVISNHGSGEPATLGA